MRALVATHQQDDDFKPTLSEIDPIAGTAIDAQFADASANWLYVAEIAQFNTPNVFWLYQHSIKAY